MSDTTNFTPAVQKRLGVIEFIRLALMRWYIYVAVTVIFAIVTFVYSSAFITPLYQSTAKLYITSKDSNSTEANQFSISTILVKDFEEMVRDKIVLEGVVDELIGLHLAIGGHNLVNLVLVHDFFQVVDQKSWQLFCKFWSLVDQNFLYVNLHCQKV